jgi:hypothetical protein
MPIFFGPKRNEKNKLKEVFGDGDAFAFDLLRYTFVNFQTVLPHHEHIMFWKDRTLHVSTTNQNY